MKNNKVNLENYISILLMVLLFACRPLPEKEGQKQPLLALSGNYSVEMPISKSNKELDYPVWTPIIKNKSGEIVYKDNFSNLSGYHNSYWDWGKIYENGNDILWVYNSDTGEVTTYYLSYGKWEKAIYDTKKGKLDPPEIIKKKIYRK